MLTRGKQAIWVVWIGSLAAMLLGFGWVATAGHLTFWLTLLAHVVEFFVNRSVFERAGGSLGHHFVQTLIYGLLHWQPIKQRQAEEAE